MRRRTITISNTEYGDPNSSVAAEMSLIDRIGVSMEVVMCKGFTSWGIVCARYPVVVIILSVAICASLATGIKWLEVTTDPIELWAAPSSISRVQKEFFDSSFRPFYRAEQIIIRAIDLPTIPFTDALGVNRTFGPIFHKEEFLYPILELQQSIENLETATGHKLKDVCNKPLSNSDACLIQNIWAYWQDSKENLNVTRYNENLGRETNYLDHLLACVKNPTLLADDDESQGVACMSRGGVPVEAFFVLGGFLPEGVTSIPKDAKFEEANSVLINFVVNNYDSKNEAFKDDLQRAMEWEKVYLDFMKNFTSRNHQHLDIAFMSERSVQDELDNETSGDIITIVLSYLFMFIYITFSLGRITKWSRFLIESKVTLGLGGIMIVLISVAASIGVFGFAGVPATLIIFEIIPFLVLAVGVDNIFILVQTFQREPRKRSETLQEHIGRVTGEVGPSMLLSSVSESTCFFLGALSDMPAVRAFALYAGMALFIDFFMQITAFISLIALDAARQEDNRFDVACCFSAPKKMIGPKPSDSESEGTLFKLFKYFYAPFLLKKWMRPAVMVVFFGWLCFSLAVVNKIEVGLDQEVSMPDDSYMLKYFNYMQRYLSTGPPMYIVVNNTGLKFDFANNETRRRLCGSANCDPYSLVNQVKLWSMEADTTYLSSGGAQSFVDDYETYMENCCKYDSTTLHACPTPPMSKKVRKVRSSNKSETRVDHDFGKDFFDNDDFFKENSDDWAVADRQTTTAASAGQAADGSYVVPDHEFSNYDDYYFDVDSRQEKDPVDYEDDGNYADHGMAPQPCSHESPPVFCQVDQDPITSDMYRSYLPIFLEQDPGAQCASAGHAAYSTAISLSPRPNKSRLTYPDKPDPRFVRYDIKAGSFMAFHSILKTSKDYFEALRWARRLSENLTETLNRNLDIPEDQKVVVFPYSVFYVFYEQYLTIWEDTLTSLGISLLAIFLVTFFLMGLDLRSSLIVIVTITMILVNLGGLMYWWNITLNAVSLVNLVMAVGISVEFCAHITRSFAVNVGDNKISRAEETLTHMGSSVSCLHI